MFTSWMASRERSIVMKILMAVTSHAEKGKTGEKTGAYLAEVSHPYDVFRRAGFEVDFVSPRGGEVPLDGVDRTDPLNAQFLDDANAMRSLHGSMRPEAVVPERYAAIFYAGGHGTMWDFPDDLELARKGASIYERGGVVAAVCHGPAALVNLKLSNGEYLVRDKDVAAFTDDEERAVGLEGVVPFLLASTLVARGARHKPAANWQKQVVVSDRLVTGQNPASAKGVAEAVVALVP
jgi:putative intracellular protease/amidase